MSERRAIHPYVAAKIAHMHRMGIPARVNEFGAAEPEWRYQLRKAGERQARGRR